MIKPINGHIIIKPLEHKTFIPQEKGLYDEVGIVVDGGDFLARGGKVYFDKWLASEYPTGEGDEFFWLVDYKDIKATDYGDIEIGDKCPSCGKFHIEGEGRMCDNCAYGV